MWCSIQERRLANQLEDSAECSLGLQAASGTRGRCYLSLALMKWERQVAAEPGRLVAKRAITIETKGFSADARE